MKKCEGKTTYAGLILHSSIDEPDDRCELGPEEPGEHRIVVTNASLLTYRIDCRSTCDKDHLEYVDADNGARHIWEAEFTAPWRWDGKARQSEDKARIAAKAGIRPKPDREVEVEITCCSAGYSPVGPFQILLQVDVEDA